MGDPAERVKGHAPTGTRHLLLWATRIAIRLVLSSALLLALLLAVLGVAETSATGVMLLAVAVAIVLGYFARLALLPLVLAIAKRVRFRFGLRTLLIVTMVSGIGLAWLGYKVRDVREQAKILRRVRDRGFLVGFDDHMPGWWFDRFGWNGVLFWGHVGVVCRDKPSTITEEDLKTLQGLRYSELSLNRSGLTDEQMRQWKPPKELKNLSAQLTGFNDKTAEHVSHFSNLEELELWGAPLSDAGVAHIARLPRLHTLGLQTTAISDSAVKHLASMKQLRELRIWRTAITPQGVEELRAALPECEIHY